MTRAIIWEQPPAAPEPGPTIRLDLAWPLFLQDTEAGFLPAQQANQLTPMIRWFWERMGELTGRLHPSAPDTVWLVCPPLSDGARELITRLASFWCDAVYWDYPSNGAVNRWAVPAVNVEDLPQTPLWTSMTESSPEGIEHSLLPMIGVGRVVMKVQEVASGSVSARLHSHTAWDEYYLILKGSGTLRMGQHNQPVSPGTFIAKPSGPDLDSHIVADHDEPVTILDMEVHPDTRLYWGGRDVMAYTDHQEIVFSGLGMEAMVPQQALQSSDDVFQHYFDGYVRTKSGHIEPQQFPGHPPRAEDKPTS